MKDYYQILGVPENARPEDIKRAFRRLAFKYHPDTNPGREKQAEERFKEINEAYGVLGDEEKRRQYDLARKGQLAGAGYDRGYGGFSYSQQDIFRDIFSNRAMMDELNRMFAQAGLRFDPDFLNRTFFSGNGFIFQVFTYPGASGWAARQDYRYPSRYRPGLIERWLIKIATKIGRFVLKTLFGFPVGSSATADLDHHVTFELSPSEAAAGGEKLVTYKRDGQVKRLVVRIPAGVKPGTKIRLKGMGKTAGGKAGNLYLHVKIRG